MLRLLSERTHLPLWVPLWVREGSFWVVRRASEWSRGSYLTVLLLQPEMSDTHSWTHGHCGSLLLPSVSSPSYPPQSLPSLELLFLPHSIPASMDFPPLSSPVPRCSSLSWLGWYWCWLLDLGCTMGSSPCSPLLLGFAWALSSVTLLVSDWGLSWGWGKIQLLAVVLTPIRVSPGVSSRGSESLWESPSYHTGELSENRL